MKKIIIMAAMMLCITGCDPERRELDDIIENCPENKLYGEHEWDRERLFIGFKYKCVQCGIERRYECGAEVDGIKGEFFKYREPSTGDFTDWRLEYEENGKKKLKKLYDISKNK